MRLRVQVQAIQDRRVFADWLNIKISEMFGAVTHASLARKADMTQSTFDSIVKAQRFPTDNTAEKLARLFDVSPLEMKRRAGLVPLCDTESRIELTNEEKEEVLAALQHALDTME
jgi:plasmid maintenance system antidote protein VapI